MRIRVIIALAAIFAIGACKEAPKKATFAPASVEITEENGILKTAVPERPAGQKSALGMTAEPIENIRIGFIGVGMRGSDAVYRFTYLPGVEIKAVCDLLQENVDWCNATLLKRGFPEADTYVGEDSWKKVCERDDIDLIYICTDWLNHVPMSLYAMEQGKHVAVEVPAAASLKDIWDLINTSERTRKHCMMLENCVYDFFEMSALTLAQSGALGEIIHAEGAYIHNLDPFWDEYWNNWRMNFNEVTRGDVYPTHGIGPICQALNIHRGDRMTTLVSMDTDPFNGPKHVKAKTGRDCPEFKNGDETSTIIRTEKGKTMLIEHDVMTPRPYDRMYQLVGTDGYAGKYPIEIVCLREEGAENVNYDNLGGEKIIKGAELDALLEQHRNPVNTPELEALAKTIGGHGGMDFIMDYRLVYCLHNGLPLDMDVYDLAEWCCLVELSRISIENGNRPVEVPDFTRGEWDKVAGYSYAFAE